MLLFTSSGKQFNFKNMKTIKKIGTNKYEITETREDKHIITIETIDKNINNISNRIVSIADEKTKLEKQKAEQLKLKATLLKVK